tara:strand:- start:75 stop:1397 length:1323 start_codon:yes stop_codon:yes gene_type:complete
MANFGLQVEGLTGLSIDASSSPTQDELSQFLKDGVLDVTRRMIALRPQDATRFLRESSISDSQGVNVGGAEIISVMREANLDGSSDGSLAWEPCKEISLSMQSKVVNPNSLHFMSKYNPVYTMNSDKTVNVYPVPSSNNGFKVSYINEEPKDITNNAALVHSHADIKYFPNSKVYLVVLYAAIKALGNYLSDLIMPLNIDEIFFSPIEDIDYTNSTFESQGSGGEGGQGGYGIHKLTITPPTVSTVGSWEDMLKGLARPTYVKPSLPDDFQETITTLIDTEEDIELSAAKQKQQQLILEEYKTEITNELNRFNMESAVYEKEVAARLQWFNAAEIPISATERSTSSASGGSGGGVALGNRGQSVASSSTNNTKAQLEFQRELQERTLKIQKYAAEVQKIGSEYQIFQTRQSALIQEYNQAFGAIRTQQEQQQRPAQQRRG